MITCYDKNPTMQLLGKQSSFLFWCNDEVRKEIQEIAEARPCSFTIEAACDIFMLGYIHGKRAERDRKKVDNCKGVLS